MADNFLGEIRIVPFNFPPSGWAQCEGQILPISQNTALFSLLGTQFGGDGRDTFALPNFQGSIPVGQGQGIGLTDRAIGETEGDATVTLLQNQIPSHAHGLVGDTSHATSLSPAGNLNAQLPSSRGTADKGYTTAKAANAMAAGNLLPAGGGLPHNNMMPYLAMNFVIALTGIFPSRP